MKILLLGKNGQVGWELQRALAPLGELVALDRRDAGGDLSLPEQVAQRIREEKPQWVVNAAAYTAVDKAESDAATARLINGQTVAHIAQACAITGAALLHYSTDYVFDGSGEDFRREDAHTSPLSVYGHTKLEGEQAIQASGCAHLILRTSWVYSRHGRNFLLTIERLAKERSRLTIVADQRGTPNWARELARATVALAGFGRDELSARAGIYHLSSRGETTWHGFAQAIVASMRLGKTVEVEPIATRDYPTPARRPAYSVLDCSKLERAFGLVLPDWEDAFAECQRGSTE